MERTSVFRTDIHFSIHPESPEGPLAKGFGTYLSLEVHFSFWVDLLEKPSPDVMLLRPSALRLNMLHAFQNKKGFVICNNTKFEVAFSEPCVLFSEQWKQ